MTRNEHVYAICCRPEVGDDVISGVDVETFRDYERVTCGWLASVVFEKKEISHLYNVQTTVGSLEPSFQSQEAKLSNVLHNGQ